MGFGGGALVAAPLFSSLLARFREAPLFLGSSASTPSAIRDGRLFVGDVEAVYATAADVVTWPGLQEGLYAVGTGSTGAATTLAVLGAGYASLMALVSLGYRLPKSSAPTGALGAVSEKGLEPSAAVKTPQFFLLWAGFGMSIMGSYGILAAGQTMLLETFGRSLPHIVTGVFAASFVAAMSTANLAGRLAWSNASDAIAKASGSDPFWGRRTAFSVMWGVGAPLYCGILWAIHANAASPGVFPLAVFSGGVCLIIASFGGAAATWPAMTADLFGTKHVGIIQVSFRCFCFVVIIVFSMHFFFLKKIHTLNFKIHRLVS